MASEFLLVAGPMVRASSWQPTADQLRQAGCSVRMPDILAHVATPPAWSAWSRCLLDHIPAAGDLVLVGHSSASALVADLATRLSVRGIIIVDGDIPPARGPAPPVRPALHDFIRTLAGPDGTLPIWSRWFSHDPQRAARIGLDRLARDPRALSRFEEGLPTMHVDWFNDSIDMANWDHVPAGFIQTSVIYDHATAEALRRGWPVARLEGTHLHPTLCPEETANAIVCLADQLGCVG